jgi:hypothetical protein
LAVVVVVVAAAVPLVVVLLLVRVEPRLGSSAWPRRRPLVALGRRSRQVFRLWRRTTRPLSVRIAVGRAARHR